MLGFGIEASKTPRNDLKVVSVIEMTLLYDAWYLFVLLRPKIRINTQHKCTQQDLAGKWAVPKGENIIHELLVTARVPVFF